DGARVLVRHVLLPTRRSVLFAAAGPQAAVAEVGEALRLRPSDGRRHRARGAGPRADDSVEATALQDGDRQALEAGRLDPARDRPGRPARHAVADGALLRADR